MQSNARKIKTIHWVRSSSYSSSSIALDFTLGNLIKGLFEATTILHDEVHASVYVPYLNLLKSRFNHCSDSAIQ